MRNDYELLYLIHGENDQIALNYMLSKYEGFIWKQIHLLHISENDFDDFKQEGILMFYKAIKTFDVKRNKTFTRYFELILKRHFYQLKRKVPNYVFDEYMLNQQQSYYLEENFDDFLDQCSDLEKEIFEYYFIQNKSIAYIKNRINCEIKQIYNAIYRLKEKYKKYDII